jgi:hypothetical protein
MPPENTEHASAGHKLGQLVGDWFEECFVLPLLQNVAGHLQLYLDHRFRSRPARGPKINWADADGNLVDYDFVLEIDGTDEQRGIPVAFVEGFWRRGARHSKDKARDDSGKLRPMRDAYPTARFLGIVASGDFTGPAREYVVSRKIDLFYVPKNKIIQAFAQCGLAVDYPDRLPEAQKAALAEAFHKGLSADARILAAEGLRELVGVAGIDTYVDRVRAAIGALPQEITVIAQKDSKPEVFETIEAATAFLASPSFDFSSPTDHFIYQVTYSDGTDFERGFESIEEVREPARTDRATGSTHCQGVIGQSGKSVARIYMKASGASQRSGWALSR